MPEVAEYSVREHLRNDRPITTRALTGPACLWRSNGPACHRFGIGMMRHLAVLARDAGLKELVAEVLPENTAMLKLFKEFRLPDRLEKIASGGPPDAATALSRGS